MQHAVGINDVETFIGKRQILAVANRKIALLTMDRQMLSRNCDRPRREIDAGDLCAAARKLQKVGAHPTADFKQARAREIVEAHHCGHPRRVLRIAVSFYGVEKLARAELLLAAVN